MAQGTTALPNTVECQPVYKVRQHATYFYRESTLYSGDPPPPGTPPSHDQSSDNGNTGLSSLPLHQCSVGHNLGTPKGAMLRVITKLALEGNFFDRSMGGPGTRSFPPILWGGETPGDWGSRSRYRFRSMHRRRRKKRQWILRGYLMGRLEMTN